MKTPRDILLRHHRGAQSTLDAIRRAALAEEVAPAQKRISLRDIFQSLRWHIAGMSAIWLFVLILHADTGQPSPMVASVSPAKIPLPKVLMVSLRENRKLLFEMIGDQPRDGERRELIIPKPRSDRRGEFSIA
jgi:hypothetical protein